MSITTEQVAAVLRVLADNYLIDVPAVFIGNDYLIAAAELEAALGYPSEEWLVDITESVNGSL